MNLPKYTNREDMLAHVDQVITLMSAEIIAAESFIENTGDLFKSSNKYMKSLVEESKEQLALMQEYKKLLLGN